MDVSELIDLIQTHLPEELTSEQIDAIRVALPHSPELQDILLEELSLEQGLATQNAPPVKDLDAVLRRLEDLATRRTRKHWLVWGAALVVAVGGLAGGILVLALGLGRQAPPTKELASNTPPAETQPASIAGPDQPEPPAGGTVAAVGPGTPAAGPDTRPAAAPAVALVPGPMTAREFQSFDAQENQAWREQVETLLKGPRGRKPQWSQERGQYDLQGTFELTDLPRPGRLIRLGVGYSERCDVELWHGNEGVRIELRDRQQPLVARTLQRTSAKDHGQITGTFSDGNAWATYRYGVVDLRYQDGQVLLCRGEVPLLRLPLSAPPTEGRLADCRARFFQIEARPCRPLPLRPAEPHVPTVDLSPTAADWQVPEHQKLKPTVGPGRAVTLAADKRDDSGITWIEVPLAPSVGVEAIVHVQACTYRSALYFHTGDRDVQVCLDQRGGKLLPMESWGNGGEIEKHYRNGQVVEGPFYCRLTVGLDYVACEASRDGKTWWHVLRWDGYTATGPLRIGLHVPGHDRPRSITIDRIQLRRYEALPALADKTLADRARQALTDKIRQESPLSHAMALLAPGKPAGAEEDAWRLACQAALLGQTRRGDVRKDAAWALLGDAAANARAARSDAVLAALEEWRLLSQPTNEHVRRLWEAVLTDLAEAALDARDDAALQRVIDRAYPMPMPRVGMHTWWNAKQVLPERLGRLWLLYLVAEDRWDDLQREALRLLFMSRERNTIESYRDDRHVIALARWCLSQARRQAGQAPPPDLAHKPSEWLHPLVVPADRQMLNIMGEFLVLVGDKSYASAAEVLTRQNLPNQLVPLGQEADLLRSSHFTVRQIIDSTPALRKVLREKYADIGMIRLKSARRRNDVDALKSIAAQFHGTQPGLEALHTLADRDLSHGSFYAAAGRYQALLGEDNYPRRADAAAKFRLASAMLGEFAGKPVTEPVAFPGKTFSPGEFERMIRDYVKQRKATRTTPTGGGAPAPAAPKGTFRLRVLTDTASRGRNLGSPRGTARTFASDARRVYVAQSGRISAIEIASAKRLWSYEPTNRSRYRRWILPIHMLPVGENLYARTSRNGRSVLACFDAQKGTVRWHAAPEDMVLSDPVMIDSWLYVIAGRQALGDVLDLVLHRISPETGESTLSATLVRLRGEAPAVGRPGVMGNGLVFRASGCLVHCDFRGVVHWVRRLPYVPRTVDEDLHRMLPLDPIVVYDRRRVLATAAGCPYVACVDVPTGKLIWRRMFLRPPRLVGISGPAAFLLDEESLTALDVATGKVLWRRREDLRYAAALPAAGDAVLLARLEDKDKADDDAPPGGRRIRWLAAKDGAVQREFQIAEQGDIKQLAELYSDGTRVYGLCNINPDRRHGKVFVLEFGK